MIVDLPENGEGDTCARKAYKIKDQMLQEGEDNSKTKRRQQILVCKKAKSELLLFILPQFTEAMVSDTLDCH